MLPFLIPLLISGAAQLVSGISKSRKADKYQKRMEDYTEGEQKKTYRDQWRAALQRSVGGKTQFAPTMGAKAPSAPSTEWEDTVGALGNIGGQVAGQYYGRKSVGANNATK